MLHQAALIRGEQIGGDDWQLAVALLLETRRVLVVGVVVLPRAAAVALVVALGDDAGSWGEDVRGCECGSRKDQSGEECGDVHRGQLADCVMTSCKLCAPEYEEGGFDKWHGVWCLCCFPSKKDSAAAVAGEEQGGWGPVFYASLVF